MTTGVNDRSNVIDRQLEDDSKKFKKECKILLLGESASEASAAMPSVLCGSR